MELFQVSFLKKKKNHKFYNDKVYQTKCGSVYLANLGLLYTEENTRDIIECKGRNENKFDIVEVITIS